MCTIDKIEISDPADLTFGFLYYNSFDQIEIWEDGSFFIKCSSRILVYDSEGNYSHTLHFPSLVDTITENANIRIVYSDFYADITKYGECVQHVTPTKEELKELWSNITESVNERGIFTSQKRYVSYEDVTYVIEMPSRFSFLGFSQSNIRISKITEAGETVIYDDNGMHMNYQLQMALFILLFVILIIIALIIELHCRKMLTLRQNIIRYSFFFLVVDIAIVIFFVSN